MKKILSYIVPIRVRKYASPINGALEVSFINGKKRLDTPNTNYSYGGLQKILHTGLSLLGFDSSTRTVLVLGLGGGSIVETIRGHFQSTAHIELVDIDPVIIEIAKNEFQIERFHNIHITEDDASVFMRESIATFDLIIVDIFIIDTIPKKFTELIFLQSLAKHLNQGGKVLYNTMIRSMPLKTRDAIAMRIRKSGLKVRVIENVGYYNDLILAER